MLSRIIGVFMPYNAMYHHAKFVLNESKLVKEEMEVINEWKAARLEELNFVGIVVRLYLYLPPLDMACTDNHAGRPPRLCHHLNHHGERDTLLAYTRPVSLGPDFCPHFHLHRHTTDNYPYTNVL